MVTVAIGGANLHMLHQVVFKNMTVQVILPKQIAKAIFHVVNGINKPYYEKI
jgi:hypothetical protein